MSDTTTEIPTLTTVDDATKTLQDLAETHDWVSVFWDRGWGDSGQSAEISVIVDGNGQQPKAWITRDVYQELLAQKVIAPNSLVTFKARKVHDFKTPSPAPEPAGPNPTDVAEQAIRRFMDEHPDLPIVARFFRGLVRGPFGPRVNEERVAAPGAVDGWFVLVLPGCGDAAISAQKPDPLGGTRIIGGGIAGALAYPKTADGAVDVDALAGDEFQALLLAVIEEKLADIDRARRALGGKE